MEGVALVTYDIQGLRADGPGGAQDGDAARGRVVFGL